MNFGTVGTHGSHGTHLTGSAQKGLPKTQDSGQLDPLPQLDLMSFGEKSQSFSYKPLDGTSMATPATSGFLAALIAEGYSHQELTDSLAQGTSLPEKTAEQKQEARDANVMDNVKRAAAESGRSLESTLQTYFFPGDDHMFQIGMSDQEIQAERQRKEAEITRLADKLGIGKTPEQQAYGNGPIVLLD